MEATARPWKISEDGNDIEAIYGPNPEDVFGICTMYADESADANAELIVRAVNNHYQLVEALKLAAKYVNKMVADDVKTAIPPANALRVIELAIRQAEGK